jgi:hypothetical protein
MNRGALEQIEHDMTALWDMPDQDMAQQLAHQLLRDTLGHIATAVVNEGGVTIDWTNIRIVDGILSAYDRLVNADIPF